MFTDEYQKLPAAIIGKLHTIYTTSFVEYANARIDTSQTGNTYLILPFPEPNEAFAILVEISEERLDILKGRGMNLIQPFKEPEKGFLYLAKMSPENQVEELALLYPADRKFKWPLPDSIGIEFNLIEKPLPFNLIEYSKERGRVAINITFETPKLKDNMKIWAVKNFLIPFTDLVKTALLSNNLAINSRNIDQKLNLGFSKIEHKCIHGILEFDYNPNLMYENTELENLENLYLLFDTENQEEIIERVKRFQNKKIIPEYIKILRAIIKNEGKLQTGFATPNEVQKEVCFNRLKSINVKRIMESGLPPDAFEETVVGVLTRLDFEKRKLPMFALHSTVDDQKYVGNIHPDLIPQMDSLTFNFRNMEYECKLKVVYTPESPLSKENYEYTLLDISEVGNGGV